MPTKTALEPIRKTRMCRTRGGTVQCWGAETTDGVWEFARIETRGTPWQVTHRPTGTVVDYCVWSLPDCQAYVASGAADADLKLIQAHQDRKHETRRNPSCPRC